MFTKFLHFTYAFHDAVCDRIWKNYRAVKIALLALAQATILGFFFPDILRDLGEQARNLLIFLLFISPLARIFPIRILNLLMGLRRQFGILFGYLAIVHGVGYLLEPGWFDYIVTPLFSDPTIAPFRYTAGILALVLTLPLLITSNNISMRLMGSKWKKLQRLVYVLLVFALFHSFLRDTTILDISGVAQVVFILGVYIGLKSLSFMPNLPMLVRVREFFAGSYRQYKYSGTRLA